MKPDPIRQAFEVECSKRGARRMPEFEDFEAGAKLAARKAVELCKRRAGEFRMRLDTGVRLDWLDVSKEEADHCAEEIRKHFGVEAP